MTHHLAVPNSINWNHLMRYMGRLDSEKIEEVGMVVLPHSTTKNVVMVKTNSDLLAHILTTEYGGREMIHN